uniref:NADH dehydrogenase subunit 4L n=1 Tax=Cycetogamasus diviortus TaxID=2978624 RepID=UPI0022F33833|nr:NADH dehydrogenase subunit 4L [Cycetogamasus diviortus]WAK85130.1 NADH dehydrogenase subunit 4L [Cycetogamasus diviortus]
MVFSVFLFFSGLFSLSYYRKHILVMLLSLEMMMVGVFMGLVFFMNMALIEMLVVYLVLVVCEASLGLSILVMSIYFYGSDNLQSYSILSC